MADVEQALTLLVHAARVSPALRDAVRVVEDDRRRMQHAAALVRAMHLEGHDSASEETWGVNARCGECGQAWPCPTIQILDAEDLQALARAG